MVDADPRFYGAEFAAVIAVAQVVAIQSLRNVCIRQSGIREQRCFTEQLDFLVFIVLQIDIACPGCIQSESIVQRFQPHQLAAEINGLPLCFGEPFFDSYSVLIAVSSAVMADVLISPLVLDLHIGEHLRQLFHYRVRGRPCRQEVQGIPLLIVYFRLAVAVGIPFGAPMLVTPPIPRRYSV